MVHSDNHSKAYIGHLTRGSTHFLHNGTIERIQPASPTNCGDLQIGLIWNNSTESKADSLPRKQKPLATCSFCRCPGQQECTFLGKMLYIGKKKKRKIFAHEGCAMWAPRVYEVDICLLAT